MEIMHIVDGQSPRVLTECTSLSDKGYYWIDVARDQDQDWYTGLQSIIGLEIHERHLHDSMNTNHPSFYDSTTNYEMLIFRGLSPTIELNDFMTRPTVFFITNRFLITVRAANSVTVALVREKLLKQGTRIPRRPIGMVHLILTTMVDRFLALREPLYGLMEKWRTELLDPKDPFDDWMSIMKHGSKLRSLEMLCEEQQDAIISLRENSRIEFDDHLAVRYTDLIEHTSRVMKFSTEQKGDVEALVQMHFSAVAHRTNEIVRVLTVLSAIFLPLSLVAGIFGMNFEYMPELKLHYAYFVALSGMLGLAAALLVVFRIKHWI